MNSLQRLYGAQCCAKLYAVAVKNLTETWKLEMSNERKAKNNDAVEHPRHYTAHPSGIECIQITEHMGFNLGNATKYIWRCDLKQDAIEDLRKAIWYIEREIAKREKENAGSSSS